MGCVIPKKYSTNDCDSKHGMPFVAQFCRLMSAQSYHLFIANNDIDQPVRHDNNFENVAPIYLLLHLFISQS